MCNISGSKEQEISLRPVHQLMITQGKTKYANTCCQIKNLVDAWIPEKIDYYQESGKQRTIVCLS